MFRTSDSLKQELFGADWKDTVMEFYKGDIVRVEYSSPRLLDEWLSGERPIGPGDVGVVVWSTGETGSQFVTNVTVEFPMIGRFGVHSCNLRLVQRAGGGDA